MIQPEEAVLEAVRALVVWEGVGEWRAEVCDVRLTGSGMTASGTQTGVSPLPYRMHYRLDATFEGFVTRSLEVLVTTAGGNRRLQLVHDGGGGWAATTEVSGAWDLPPPGGDLAAVTGALDCDLGLCPATNTMPVLRHGLHRAPGERDFLMAWVSVPDLGVFPSRQRYEHVRLTPSGSVVRYVGEHRDFVGELELDRHGLVEVYPDLARRVGAGIRTG